MSDDSGPCVRQEHFLSEKDVHETMDTVVKMWRLAVF